MKFDVATVLLLGAAAIGFANVRAQQKCRERRTALQKLYGTTDPAELRRRIIADGGDIGGMPGCTGFIVHKEGV